MVEPSWTAHTNGTISLQAEVAGIGLYELEFLRDGNVRGNGPVNGGINGADPVVETLGGGEPLVGWSATGAGAPESYVHGWTGSSWSQIAGAVNP